MSTTSSIAMPSSERVPYFDTIVRAVLAVYIAVLPFKSLLVVERNGFILLLGLLVGWCVTNRRFFYSRTPYDMLLLAFVVWVGLTIPFSVAPSYSVKEYGKLLQHMVVFYAVIYFFKGLFYRQVLCGLVGVMAIVVAGYGLSQFNLENPQAVVSFLPAEVWLTTFLVMVIPFGLALALGEGLPEIRTGGALAVGLMTACLIAHSVARRPGCPCRGTLGDCLVHPFGLRQDCRCLGDGLCGRRGHAGFQCEHNPFSRTKCRYHDLASSQKRF